jgi:hypothetical protein
MKDHFIDNVDFYERLYIAENERTKFYDKVIQYPTTILIVIFGGFFYSLNNYFSNGSVRLETILDSVFIILSILFLLSTMVTVFFLIKVFHGLKRDYKYIPYSMQLLEHENSLIEHYFKESNKESKKERLKEAKEKASYRFWIDLKKQYAEYCDFNQKRNDERAKNYFLTKTFIVINLSLLVIIGIFGNL